MIKKGLYECVKKDSNHLIYANEVCYIKPSLLNIISKKIKVIIMSMRQNEEKYEFVRCKDITIIYQNESEFFEFWKRR